MDYGTDEIMRTVKDYAERLQEYMAAEVWVFGSRIRGEYEDDSDLDIAVVSPEFDTDYFGANLKAHKALRGMDTAFDIEIHGFGVKRFRENTPLVSEIKRTGVQVFPQE